MTPARTYPEEAIGGFPVPPTEIRDAEGRPIHLERVENGSGSAMSGLIEMYDDFDPADRAQGIPPVGQDRIQSWLEMVLEAGPDVIARRDDEVIGHATLVPDEDEEYELAIFVHQDYQRQGVGSSLLRVLLGTASQAGIEYVWLTVERWNAVAISLYESVGFQTCDSGSFELEMSIRLSPDYTESTG